MQNHNPKAFFIRCGANEKCGGIMAINFDYVHEDQPNCDYDGIAFYEQYVSQFNEINTATFFTT